MTADEGLSNCEIACLNLPSVTQVTCRRAASGWQVESLVILSPRTKTRKRSVLLIPKPRQPTFESLANDFDRVPEERIMRNFQRSQTATIGRVALLAALIGSSAAHADMTSGGVSWLDTLTYTKPTFMPLAVPDESGVANKYYVDMSNGSGSACTQSAPCASIAAVSGKPGTSGGPAYIYMKGNGYLNITGSTLAGCSGEGNRRQTLARRFHTRSHDRTGRLPGVETPTRSAAQALITSFSTAAEACSFASPAAAAPPTRMATRSW